MKIKISDEINLVVYPDGDVAISEPGEDLGIVLHANELDKIAEHAGAVKRLRAELDQARTALGLARSMVLSGERMSDQAAEIITRGLKGGE